MIEAPTNHGSVLAQEPVTFTIDIQRKWWQRYFPKRYPPKKEYSIRPMSHGNAVRVSDILLKIKDTKEGEKGNASQIAAYHKLNTLHARDQCRIVAIAIAGSKEGPTDALVDELFWNLTPTETLRLAVIVLQQLNIQGFMLTTDLMIGLDVIGNATKSDEKSPSEIKTGPQVPGNMQAA